MAHHADLVAQTHLLRNAEMCSYVGNSCINVAQTSLQAGAGGPLGKVYAQGSAGHVGPVEVAVGTLCGGAVVKLTKAVAFGLARVPVGDNPGSYSVGEAGCVHLVRTSNF